MTMPQIDYSYPAKNIRITKGMVTPKKITELYKGWFREAKKVIPQIPDVPEYQGANIDSDGLVWRLYEVPSVTPDFIHFRFENNQGDKSTLTIARRISMLGR